MPDRPDPRIQSLEQLKAATMACRECPIGEMASQSVIGEGKLKARLMLVGEQPGDEEDRRGEPFVGPAGRLLDRALEAAGVDRTTLYVTNAVKHFKWEPRGKRRLHKTPAQREIEACRPWLEAEIAAVHPEVICCLGATAAKALLGPDFRVSLSRGKLVKSPYAPRVFATLHPSAVLRVRGAAERAAAFKSLVRDLALMRSTAPARPARRSDRPGSSAPRSGPNRLLPSGRRAG